MEKMISSISSQPDWDKFWRNTTVSLSRSQYRKLRYLLLAKLGVRECLKLLKNRPVSSLIELGGGGACLSSRLAQRMGLSSEALVLIDNSLEGQRAWAKFSGFGHFIRGNLLTYNFGRQKFDLVLSCGLIEHWADKGERLQVIKKHAQLSKQLVLIRVPREGPFMTLFRYNPLAIKLLRMMPKVDGFEKLYQPQELKKEISEAGLKIIGLRKDFTSLTVLARVKKLG